MTRLPVCPECGESTPRTIYMRKGNPQVYVSIGVKCPQCDYDWPNEDALRADAKRRQAEEAAEAEP